MPRMWSFGGVTAVGDGAIVVWPQVATLQAARLGPDGAMIDARKIATFDYSDFADTEARDDREADAQP